MKENLQICEECSSLEPDKFLKKCLRCGAYYCAHNSSDADIRYCFHCLQVDVTVTSITREVKRINPKTGQTIVNRVPIGIDYQFDGSDWLFMAQKIKDFAFDLDGDYKFTKMIEYHRAMEKLMFSYREDVRQAKMDKLRATGGVVRMPGQVVNGSSDKVLSSTISSPEAIARKRIAAVLKVTFGRDATVAEVDAAMKAMGLGK